MRKWIARVAWLFLGLLVLGMLGMGACEIAVERAARDRCYDDLGQVPRRHAGLVLGTSKFVRGKVENLHYKYRIEAAAELYHAGKVDFLIVSGNGVDPHYNEPRQMKADLVALGVPEDRILPDERGLRTLDSVVRAAEKFGEKDFIVISQRWHNARAIFLSRAHGDDPVAWNARAVGLAADPRTVLRERLARVLAVLDVTVLNKRPRSDQLASDSTAHARVFSTERP